MVLENSRQITDRSQIFLIQFYEQKECCCRTFFWLLLMFSSPFLFVCHFSVCQLRFDSRYYDEYHHYYYYYYYYFDPR